VRVARQCASTNYSLCDLQLFIFFIESRTVGAIHELPLHYDFARGTHEGGATLRMLLRYFICF